MSSNLFDNGAVPLLRSLSGGSEEATYLSPRKALGACGPDGFYDLLFAVRPCQSSMLQQVFRGGPLVSRTWLVILETLSQFLGVIEYLLD